MIKKTVKFTDFNDNEQSVDLYFNLSKAELAKMQLKDDGGDFAATLQAIVDSNNGALIISKFEEIIAMAYGERSIDGKHFYKSPEIIAKFEASAAYSELFMELVTDANSSAEFIRGLVPASLSSEMDATPVEHAMTAREASEAKLQGFQKKQETPKPTSVQSVPELPTTQPVLEESVDKPLSGNPFAGKTDAEIAEMVRTQGFGQSFLQ